MMRLVHFAGEGYGRAVRKVATHAEVQPENNIAVLQYSKLNCGIGLCSTVRLYIYILDIEDLLGAVDG